MIGALWEATRSVPVDTVGTADPVSQGVQRRIIDSRGGEGVLVGRVVALRSVVGGEVHRVGSHRNGRGEGDLLPSVRAFTRERRRREQRAAGGP
jgi:hypothetical protein